MNSETEKPETAAADDLPFDTPATAQNDNAVAGKCVYALTAEIENQFDMRGGSIPGDAAANAAGQIVAARIIADALDRQGAV